MIHMLQWQGYQLMQQQQFQQVAAAAPERPALKPMYAAAILGKPISDSGVNALIGPSSDGEADKPTWAEDLDPRDRESGREPVLKWD
eukprot:8491511-Karenia_brevis.AAC.1